MYLFALSSEIGQIRAHRNMVSIVENKYEVFILKNIFYFVVCQIHININ